MATIVTRAGKGSALTWTEGDANITNLNNELVTKLASLSTANSGRIVVGGTSTAPTVDLASGIATAGTYAGKITVDTYGRITAATNDVTGYTEPVYDLGTTGGTIAPNVANGNVQKITLNSALTMNAFTSPVAGQSLTLIIYGGTAYTSITSTMKFAGGVKTLTGTAGCIDILSVYYDGTNYFASLGKGFA